MFKKSLSLAVAWIATIFMFSFSNCSATTSKDVVERMHEQSLTRYNTVSDFMWDGLFTREQASRFFGELATNVYKKKPNTYKDCSFYDIDKADPTLKQYIIKSCQLWLFQWSKWKFMPKKRLTNAQAVTVMVRLLRWEKLDETIKPWYQDYYIVATQEGFLQWLWLANIKYAEKNSTRWEVWSMFYKAYKIRSAKIKQALKIAKEKAKVEEEAKKLAEEKARIEAEARRIAEEKAQAEVEARRIAEEKAQAEVEARRIAEEKAQAEAEAKKLAEEKAKAEAEAKKIAEQKAKEKAKAEWLKSLSSSEISENKLYNVSFYAKRYSDSKEPTRSYLFGGDDDSIYRDTSVPTSFSSKFYITSYGDGTFRIFHEKSRVCLTSQWKIEESEIWYQKCNDNDNQRRHLERNPNDYKLRFRLKWTNLCSTKKWYWGDYVYFYLKPCEESNEWQRFIINEISGTHYTE